MSGLPQATYNLPTRLAEMLQSEAVISFPPVATLGTYRQWFEAMRPTGDEDNDSDHRLYRAALAIGALEVSGELGADDTAVYASAGEDTPNPQLSVEIQQWVIDSLEQYLGEQIIVQSIPDAVQEAWASKHVSPFFEVDDLLDRLPALSAFAGGVAFPAVYRAHHKRAWEQVIGKHPAEDPAHVDNSQFLRQYHAALGLAEDGIGVSWLDDEKTEVSWRKVDDVPLVLASWLVKVTDIYIMVRTDPKKLRRMFAPMSMAPAKPRHGRGR